MTSNLISTGTQYCNRCGKSYEPYSYKRRYIPAHLCYECSVSFDWRNKIEKKFCVMCGHELNKIAIVYSIHGKTVHRERFEGHRYCKTCAGQFKTYGSTAHTRAAIRWQKSNPEKAKAQSLAKYHSEKVNILYECRCRAEKKHNHHFDYSRPFEVIRLCADCHRAEHARLQKLTKDVA